jgi:hypothetical protein
MDANHRAATSWWMLRAQFEKISNVAVQNEIYALLGDDDRSYGGQYGDLLRRMSQAALEYALANNIEPRHFEYEVLRDGLSVVGGLRYAFINDPSNRSPNFLDHGNPIDLIKTDKVPHIDRIPHLRRNCGDGFWVELRRHHQRQRGRMDRWHMWVIIPAVRRNKHLGTALCLVQSG